MNDLLTASATELARLVRAKRVSPVELVDAHIARIEAVNPAINAVVADRFDEARSEARAAEERLAGPGDAGALPPFFGVPCTMKEFFAVAGMPNTGGVMHRLGEVARRDAVVVQRVRAAGAIVLGVTNVPEGGLWMESVNRIYGRTSNPWSLDRTSGGSSGGEAAIIAAGGSPFGMGSDIGGSIRLPAAFCGVCGHKPTGRMVPNTGHWPPLAGNLNAYLVCGPLARSADDLMPLLKTIAGSHDPHDGVSDWALGDAAGVNLQDVAVFPMETNGAVRIGERMRGAVRDAARALAGTGARTRHLRVENLRHSIGIFAAMMASEPGGSYAEVLTGKPEMSVARELVGALRGTGPHTVPALVVAATEKVLRLVDNPARTAKLIEMGRDLKRELEDALGPNGVILHPPYTRPAPRHRRPLFTPFDVMCTAIYNVLDFPGTVVPIGVDDRGLPLSVQILAKPGNDHLTIAVGQALQAEFGAYRPVDPRPGR